MMESDYELMRAAAAVLNGSYSRAEDRIDSLSRSDNPDCREYAENLADTIKKMGDF